MIAINAFDVVFYLQYIWVAIRRSAAAACNPVLMLRLVWAAVS